MTQDQNASANSDISTSGPVPLQIENPPGPYEHIEELDSFEIAPLMEAGKRIAEGPAIKSKLDASMQQAELTRLCNAFVELLAERQRLIDQL